MWHYVAFNDRAMIRVAGKDRADFLQGLITQDIGKLSDKQKLLYGAFLTPQGKFLYDFFIWLLDDETIGLDLHKDDADALKNLLSRYTLRKDVTFEVLPQTKYQIFQSDDKKDKSVLPTDFNWSPVLVDPRLESLGYQSLEKPSLPETSLDVWTKHRLQFDVPECRADLRNGLSSPFEGNIDLLNGIAFDKGCYLGQELVSRIHHRGLVKRRFPNL